MRCCRPILALRIDKMHQIDEQAGLAGLAGGVQSGTDTLTKLEQQTISIAAISPS